jgi:ABC-type multidrug transport system fused ATPase/permease subunit
MNAVFQRRQLPRRLTLPDLYPVPATMRAAFLSDQFRRHYNTTTNHPSRRLVRTLWHLARPTFVPAGFCQLLSVLSQVLMPLLVRELLSVLQNNPNQKVLAAGIPYAVALFGTAVGNAFMNHRHRHLAVQSGIVMRAATVAVLYRQALTLTAHGRHGLTSGAVTNLIAVDAQKLYEVAQDGHLIWALPLSVVLVTVFLILILGPTTLVGIGVLVLFVPVVERITRSMMNIRKARVKETDKRIEITNGMFQGVSRASCNAEMCICCSFLRVFASMHDDKHHQTNMQTTTTS